MFRRMCVLVGWVCLLLSGAAGARAGLVEELSTRLRAEWTATPPREADVARWLATQAADGSWPDIDYGGKFYMGWQQGQHPERLRLLACAAARRNDPRVVSAVQRGLVYWRQRALVAPNWWHNEIGVPMNLGQMSVLLAGRLGGLERKVCEEIRARKTINRAGQNGVWAAEVDLQAALVLNDEPLVRRSIETILGALRVPRVEGLQTDWSFQQHGPQLHFGNYGLAFAGDLVSWVDRLKGLPFLQKQDPRVVVLRNYLTRGLAVATWQGSLDQSGMGRLTYPFERGQGAAGAAVERLLRRMAVLDPDAAGLYRDAADSVRPGGGNRLVGLKLFYRTDFVVQRRPASYVSVRLTSKRIKGSERSAEQNLLGHYLSDGVMWFMRDGREYRDVFPVLDWRRLPGVTCPVDGPLPAFPAFGGSDFAGGVTDGTNGCVGMDLRRAGLSASKAWFFAGDTVVCLGAGIRTESDVQVETTVNQARRDGAVVLDVPERPPATLTGSGTQAGPATVTHGGWSYLIPPGRTASWSVEKQTGDWPRVVRYAGVPKDPVELEMFRIGFPHGRSPAGAAYAYAVMPARAPGAPAVRWDSAGFRVVSNTPGVQAVWFSDRQLLQALFRGPGSVTLDGGRQLTVGGACAVQVHVPTGGLWVADPTHQQETVTVEWAGTRWMARLPDGEESGRTERR